MVIENGYFNVYVHTNKINGKMYVGITKRNVQQRWKNGFGYVDSPYFYNSIQKYGWDNFDHEIISSNLTEEEAMHMEELLIKELHLTDDIYGYNIKNGGTNCSLSEETKQKIGDALRGRKHNEEIRKMQSEIKKGKKLSPEHCAAISKGNKGRPRTEKEMAAAKIHGDKMRGDNHWTRRLGIKEETKSRISQSMRAYLSKNGQHEGIGKKKVLCVETRTVYDSIESAAKSLNICRSQISEACVGIKRKTAGNYHWKFV